MESQQRRFVLQFAACLFVILILFAGLLVWLVSTGVDDRYPKFSNPVQKSMVLGTSYAAKGIVPSLLNQTSLSFEGPLYNFALTNPVSRWGPAYERAIRMKLDPNTRNGLFVLQTNPNSFREGQDQIEDLDEPEEGEPLLNKLSSMTAQPNWDYLLTALQDPLWEVALKKWQDRVSVENDGWRHYKAPLSEKAIASATKRLLDNLRELNGGSPFSDRRWNYFVRVIEFLDQHGTVVLVRLPSTQEFVEYEDRSYPSFDEKVKALAAAKGLHFLNYKGQHGTLLTEDGAHLQVASAVAFSKELADTLQKKGLSP